MMHDVLVELTPAHARGGSRIVSERVPYDQITVLSLNIRKDRPEETV